MKPRILPSLASLLLLSQLAMVPAGATVVTYSDKSAFLSATSAADATGALPASSGALYGPTTVGSVTFNAVSGGQAFYFGDWSSRFAGSEISIDAKEDLNVSFAGAVTSFGFDFVEPEFDPFVYGTFVDSTFTVSLYNGASFVDSFSFNAANDTAAFAGVWADSVFTRAEIRETTGHWENEFYGRFYTGTVAMPVGVPDGGSSGLLALTGLAALAAFRRSR